MRLLIIVLILASQHSYALDFKEILGRMKTEVRSLLGKHSAGEKPPFEMPKIPRAKGDVKSVDVYEKTGKIYTQGTFFQKLPIEQKRRFWLSFVKELHFVVKGAEASQNELVTGVSILEQGGSREGIYNSIVHSSEYMSLENYNEKPTPEMIDYGFNYGIKYLGLQYNKKDLMRLNLWGLKKFLVDKTLLIINAFPKDGEDLFKWYAYLSVEMSRKYSGLWSNQVRLNKDLLFHYKWAKKVPLEQIKSEVIIKIHKLLNSLQ